MLSQIVPGNREKRSFSAIEQKVLGNYVYCLRDPRDKKIFYVGQGTGNRVFDHFKDAEACLKNNYPLEARLMRILEIWCVEEDVEWRILASKLGQLPGPVPLIDVVESAILDALTECQNGSPLNIISGKHSSALSPEDLRIIDATPINPVNAHSAVFLFPIQNALANGSNPYDSTRMFWSVIDKYRNIPNAVAVGIKSSISFGSFKIQKWLDGDNQKQFFEGIEYPDMLNKNCAKIISASKGYWQRGNYLVVEFDGKGLFRFLRGNPDCSWRSLRSDN